MGCNAVTGQCECLPGVVGEKCDHCPYRWVLIPDSGCQECDVCHHALLDVTDALENEINPVIIDFNTIAGGYFTSQKLNYFENLTKQLEPRVKLLNPNNINALVIPLQQEIDSLEQDVINHNKKYAYDAKTAEELKDESGKLLANARAFIDTQDLVSATVSQTIRDVKKLADSFATSESCKYLLNLF